MMTHNIHIFIFYLKYLKNMLNDTIKYKFMILQTLLHQQDNFEQQEEFFLNKL